MGIEGLKRFHANCKPLKNNERKRLSLMLENDMFDNVHSTIKYMLCNKY